MTAKSVLRQVIGRYRERFLLTPYPRLSIAAAKSKDRARDSSSNGIATLFQDEKPRKLWPRNFCACLILETDETS